MATLGRLAHEKLIDPAVGKLLDDLKPLEEDLGFDDDDAALIRATRREYERSVKIPASWTSRFLVHSPSPMRCGPRLDPKTTLAPYSPIWKRRSR